MGSIVSGTIPTSKVELAMVRLYAFFIDVYANKRTRRIFHSETCLTWNTKKSHLYTCISCDVVRKGYEKQAKEEAEKSGKPSGDVLMSFGDTGMSFGTASTSSSSTGLTFGTTNITSATTTDSSGFTFGTTDATDATSTGLSFGT